MGLSWSWWALTLLDMGKASGAFQRSHPCSPRYQNPAIQYSIHHVTELDQKNILVSLFLGYKHYLVWKVKYYLKLVFIV